ncbi:hypothetical protein HUJ04_007588 [Dendroctonus ponderosae]|nr:hypothetical protein HUJ04_007588 [Dendroctonus ponderosae]
MMGWKKMETDEGANLRGLSPIRLERRSTIPSLHASPSQYVGSPLCVSIQTTDHPVQYSSKKTPKVCRQFMNRHISLYVFHTIALTNQDTYVVIDTCLSLSV